MPFANIEYQGLEKTIKKHIEEFMNAIKKETSIASKTLHTDKSDFPIFRPANAAYFEYKYFEGVLEWYIRDYLVTRILCSLFSNQELVSDIEIQLPEEKRNVVHFRYSNASFGDDYPFAFILQIENTRIGYRYSGLCMSDEEIDGLFTEYNLSHIEIVDWSDTDSIKSEYTEWGVSQEYRQRIFYVTLHELFISYFSEEGYQLYITEVRNAVQAANNEIGFQTIPALSLRYISDFKTDFLNRISKDSLKKLSYRIFDLSGNITGDAENMLSPEDYAILDDRFFCGGLYKSLIGSEKFARCFLTSEYLYSIFMNGDSVSFDYSAVVTGYFKSVELVLNRIKEIWLQNTTVRDDLWIAGGTPWQANNDRISWCRPNPATGKPQVQFVTRYEKHFKTEMGPLIWLIHDNDKGSYLSDSGKELVHRCLLNYNQGCRNEHLHKDIIADIQTVECIRNNTLLCIYYLLGGCRLNDSINQDTQALVIENDSYERLYKTLLKIPSGMSDFYIQFAEKEPIKVFRRYDQDRPAYDEFGRIISPIRFVIVNDFSDISFETDKEYLALMSSLQQLELTRNSLPRRLWWYTRQKGRVEITW